MFIVYPAWPTDVHTFFFEELASMYWLQFGRPRLLPPCVGLSWKSGVSEESLSLFFQTFLGRVFCVITLGPAF